MCHTKVTRTVWKIFMLFEPQQEFWAVKVKSLQCLAEAYINLWTPECFNTSISIASPFKNLSSPHVKEGLGNEVWIHCYVWDPDRFFQKTWWCWALKLQMRLDRDQARLITLKRILATLFCNYLQILRLFYPCFLISWMQEYKNYEAFGQIGPLKKYALNIFHG